MTEESNDVSPEDDSGELEIPGRSVGCATIIGLLSGIVCLILFVMMIVSPSPGGGHVEVTTACFLGLFGLYLTGHNSRKMKRHNTVTIDDDDSVE